MPVLKPTQFTLLICLCFLHGFGQSIPSSTKSSKPDDLLRAFNGKFIKSKTDWERIRRPEILRYYEQYVYGERPDFKPRIRYELKLSDTVWVEGTEAIHQEVFMHFYWKGDSLKALFTLFFPIQKPHPAMFLGMNFYGNQTISTDTSILLTESYVENSEKIGINNHKANHASRGKRAYRWPLGLILKSGYGLATCYYGDFDPDYDDGFKNGIHGLANQKKGHSNPTDWGAISAWAYGLSAMQSYLENDARLSKSKTIVVGHSRLGKAALWAAATDSRFDMAISNNSGCGGATQFKLKKGEDIATINTKFPHWFCGNFKVFNHKEDSLMLDQHMLISLIAPRPVYVASASEDLWANPEGEFTSLCLAVEVYRLYQPALNFPCQWPGVGESLSKPPLFYHLRQGKHDILEADWQHFIRAADVYFGKK